MSPDPLVNCIRNVTFRNMRFHAPIKAIYIKPDYGTHGTGIIDSITYEDIVAEHALWWGIWISPQQEAHSPCSFLYPFFNSTCETTPLVPVTNLVLRNVTMMHAILSPGVLRCNDTGPCSGWLFEDVNVAGSDGDAFFLCQGI